MIKCRKCLLEQPEEEFYVIRATGGRRTQCRTCVKAGVVQWQRDNKPRVREKWLRSKLKTRYGITVQEREEMLRTHGGVCWICGSEPHPVQGLAVDHCHATGRVRGMLCHSCNKALGFFKDDPALLRRAADYLNTPR